MLANRLGDPDTIREQARSYRCANRRALYTAALMLACACPSPSGAQTQQERGEYLLRAAGCAACHTDTDNEGGFLAGGRALETPFGVFHAPNITPHPELGIGRWTDEQFHSALTLGEGPGGMHYAPVFPYTAYTRMRPDDVRALWKYLQSVPRLAVSNRPHELPWYMPLRMANRVWKWLFFEAGEYEDDRSRPEDWNRGAYLVTALGHCAECHSPRDRFGAIIDELRFAGTRQGPEGDAVPNITPDTDTGIGDWTRSELVAYLSKGRTPDDDFAGGLMAEVIDDSLSYLSASDIEAIITYLKSLPPIRHVVVDHSEEAEEDF